VISPASRVDVHRLESRARTRYEFSEGHRGSKRLTVSYEVRQRTYPESGRTVWQVDIHCIPAGETRRRRLRFHPEGIASERAAKRWADQMQAELIARGDLRRNEATTPEPEPTTPPTDAPCPAPSTARPCPTLGEFGDAWLDYGRANRQKPSTLDNKSITFRVYLDPVLGKHRLDQIGAVEILKLKAALSELAASSTNQVLLVLSSVLTTARKLGHITEQPKIELVKATPVYDSARSSPSARRTSTSGPAPSTSTPPCGTVSGRCRKAASRARCRCRTACSRPFRLSASRPRT
jgi:Phage integrase, N-terminal SAM-like domain